MMIERCSASASVSVGSQLSRLPRKCWSITSGVALGAPKRRYAKRTPAASTNCVSAVRCVAIAISAVLMVRLDLVDGVLERVLEATLTDGPEDERKRAALEVLALADDDGVDVGRAVGLRGDRVDVARVTAPDVRVR